MSTCHGIAQIGISSETEDVMIEREREKCAQTRPTGIIGTLVRHEKIERSKKISSQKTFEEKERLSNNEKRSLR
jgi:hypothetical protein